MLRRAFIFRNAGAAAGSASGGASNMSPHGTPNLRFQSGQNYDDDRRGPFNHADVADKLGIPPRYAQGLMMEAAYHTFHGKGHHYPASMGRTSRPNARSCLRHNMFPLYRTTPDIRYALQKSHKKITNQ
jgi:hypothetical protein